MGIYSPEKDPEYRLLLGGGSTQPVNLWPRYPEDVEEAKGALLALWTAEVNRFKGLHETWEFPQI